MVSSMLTLYIFFIVFFRIGPNSHLAVAAREAKNESVVLNKSNIKISSERS